MRQLLISMYWLSWLAWAPAQSPRLEAISIEHGLSQGFVRHICQDKEGFMWFGTNDGLNRYDGYEFRVINYDPLDGHSLVDPFVLSVLAFDEFMWVSSGAKGYSFYHRKTQRAYRAPSSAGERQTYLSAIGEANRAVWSYWATPRGYELYRQTWPEDIFERLEGGARLEDELKTERVPIPEKLYDVELSADGNQAWLLGEDEVWVRDILSGQVRRVALPFDAQGYRRAHKLGLTRLLPDMADGVWLFIGHRVAYYDGHSWQEYQIDLPDFSVLHFDRDRKLVWLAVGNEWVHCLDLNELPMDGGALRLTWRLHIPERALSAYTDRNGNVWFGTDAKGVRKFSPRSGVFGNYLTGYPVYSPPFTDGSGRVWLGDVRRDASQAIILDLDTGTYGPMFDLGRGVPKSDVRVIRDDQGIFWVYYLVPGSNPIQRMLCSYDARGRPISQFPIPAEWRGLNAVLRYVGGDIWMASSGELLRFDIRSQVFTLFSADTLPEFPGAFALERTFDGSWWIGSESGLMHVLPRSSGGYTFQFLSSELTKDKLPGFSFVKALLADPDHPHILWIGTHGQGLYRYDITSGQYVRYHTGNGLPNNVVYGILADDETPRRLWISTNKGLTCFTPVNGHFQYYLKSDGLQDDEFNTHASYKSPEGSLLFGGVNGLTIFQPRELRVNRTPPLVRLTGLKINGTLVSPLDSAALLDMDILYAEQLVLPYSMNNLVLQFAADDYTQPRRNQFAFYLEGAETEWIHRGTERNAQYLNLAPGRYVFHVKAANSDGIWGTQPRSLQIIIRPPWYRAWWAYLMYFLIGTWGVYSIYHIQWKRRLARSEAVRLKELDVFKSQVYVNITHEFRTPLTVILGLAREAISDPERWTRDSLLRLFEPIERNGARLLRLVNQVLDLAKLEDNSLRLNMRRGDVIAYMRYIMESFQSLANARNQVLRFHSPLSSCEMDFDPERMAQIINNLLSNALKHTPSGGAVLLTVDSPVPNRIQIEVRDTGTGIPAEALPHIFHRFYQAPKQTSPVVPGDESEHSGTGIGLALTRELVKLFGGEIHAESHTEGPERGSVFRLWLPVTKNAPLLHDFSGVIEEMVDTLPATIGIDPEMDLTHEDQPLVLLVEDNADVVEFVRSVLQPYFRVQVAYNGRVGEELAYASIPDLIVSDLMMPEKDGLELCAAIKNDSRTEHIPIVLLTARAAVEDRVAGLVHGADAYLTKPFHREELLATLNGLIEQRRRLQLRYAGQAIAPPAEKEIQEHPFLQQIREIVGARLDDAELSGEDVCRALSMSYPVVYRKLSALTGRSLKVYIRLIRLQKAREWLLSNDSTISEIAYSLGFNDPKFFSRVFAEEFGLTPTAYRNSHRP